MFSVSQSKVKTWRNCRQAYSRKYKDKLIRKRTRRPFVAGRLIHKMIESKAQGEDPFEVIQSIDVDEMKIFEAEKEMYGEILTDLTIIMSDYFEYHTEDALKYLPVKDETGEYRWAEHEFAIPLVDLLTRGESRDRSNVNDILFKGQIDALGKTPNGLKWLVEHKSFEKKLPDDDERWRNVQSVVYVRAVEALGWIKKVDGTLWDYVMTKAPTVPQVLKDGSRLSVKEIVTLPSVVRASLRMHKFTDESHAELLARAENSRHDYFKRIYTPLSKTVADNVFSGFVDTAVEMRDNNDRCDKNIGRHCGWCDYEPLCRAELTGADVDYVREKEFEIEDPDKRYRLKVLGQATGAKPAAKLKGGGDVADSKAR